MPMNAAIVVATAAPFNSYTGMKIVFNIRLATTNIIDIAIGTFGLPLAIITFANIPNIVRKANPTTKILKGPPADKYLLE